MPENNENDFKVFLKKIQKQFLCCYPLHCILWHDFPKDLDWDKQKLLMDYTFNATINKQFPINSSYQINFLKKLLTFLEKHCSEVHDAVYETFCRIQQNLAHDCTEKYAFKHYIVNPEIRFTIRESKSFVAEGTTGLCSWQASLALADFLITNPSLTRDKFVLELGGGTGLCGLMVFKLCQPRSLLLSDGSQSCVELMLESLIRNFPHALKENNKFMVDSQIVQCSVLPWESIEEVSEIVTIKPDIIIAADVVYDDSCFKDLSFAIDYVFKLKENKVQMYLAATVRNEHTLNKFLVTMGSLRFNVSECGVVSLEESHLYWDRSTPVKILKFTR